MCAALPRTFAPASRYPSMEPCGPAPAVVGVRPGNVPNRQECERLWDAYSMPDHIRGHSAAVAEVAVFLANKAAGAGLAVQPQEVEAAALLHDLAKPYTILHGGNHSQLGGAWVMRETGNARIACGVVHHVYWPWEVDVASHFLPLTVLYADKRVRHEECVRLGDRFEDLFARYGKTAEIRERIELSRVQAVTVEKLFNNILRLDLDACPFTGRGLVG